MPIIIKEPGVDMGNKRHSKSLILPIEDWAEDIASRKPRRHVIQDLLPSKRGEYIAIAGRTGIGKTNLSMHLGLCIATGSPFFGLKCRRMRVALLAFEGDEHNLMERYDKIKSSFPPTDKRLHFGMIPLSNPRSMLKEIWNQTEECRIVIIVRWTPSLGQDRGNVKVDPGYP